MPHPIAPLGLSSSSSSPRGTVGVSQRLSFIVLALVCCPAPVVFLPSGAGHFKEQLNAN
jgi:hypothetical protein